MTLNDLYDKNTFQSKVLLDSTILAALEDRVVQEADAVLEFIEKTIRQFYATWGDDEIRIEDPDAFYSVFKRLMIRFVDRMPQIYLDKVLRSNLAEQVSRNIGNSFEETANLPYTASDAFSLQAYTSSQRRNQMKMTEVEYVQGLTNINLKYYAYFFDTFRNLFVGAA